MRQKPNLSSMACSKVFLESALLCMGGGDLPDDTSLRAIQIIIHMRGCNTTLLSFPEVDREVALAVAVVALQDILQDRKAASQPRTRVFNM